jgi:dihydroorotase
MNDLLIHGGRTVSHAGPTPSDVLIRDGRIAAVGPNLPAPEGVVRLDAAGKLVLPGMIDPQVHFREPGLERKEDLESGSRAAVAGGVTSFMEMPNTKPATVTREAIEDKLARAHDRAWGDHAFFVGATADNADHLGELESLPGCAGVKMFMGSSTGGLLVRDDATVERVLRSGSKRVTVHSEDEDILEANYKALGRGVPVTEHPNVRSIEAAVRCTTRLLNLAEKTGRPVHVLHISTAEEVDLFVERDLGELVTFEVTPNHVFLHAPDCYEQHGSWAQMNPPVRDARHRDRLREALATGLAACIGSDHAPHTADEKAHPYPQSPSGIPGVQTTLALMLTAIRDGWLQWTDLLRLCNEGPRRVYGIERKGLLEPGVDGDVVLIDPDRTGPLEAGWLESRSPCNPFVGRELAGLPVTTVLRGQVVYDGGRTVGAAGGRPLAFR